MRNKITVTMRRLPTGSVIEGNAVDVSYQIEKISGAISVNGYGKTYRAGDRIAEKDAELIEKMTATEVVMLKGAA